MPHVHSVSPVVAALNRVGRRGAFLGFLALIDLIIGYTLSQPLPMGLPKESFYAPFVTVMPLTAWSWWWTLTGLGALVSVGWHRPRTIVFGVAAAIKTAWAIGYLVGWAQGLAAFSRGYYSAAIFVTFAVIVLLVSGWRENGQ